MNNNNNHQNKNRSEEYYKCIIKSILSDNDVDADTFNDILDNHIKYIIAENIKIDVMNIAMEILKYIATFKPKK